MAKRFGYWTVIGLTDPGGRSDGGKIPYRLARCRCGTVRSVSLANLKSGKSKSCGCFRRKRTTETKIVHGDARKGAVAPEYSIWQAMIKRCRDPDNADYGGRGIKVCSRWLRYENFLADMGRRPSKRHSLDRYPDNDGGYDPTNCRWATAVEQRANQRPRKRLDQFGDAELAAELERRGYRTGLTV